MAILLMTATILLSINQVFFVTKSSYYYLLLDLDILENMVDLIHKEGNEIYLCFVICRTHKGPITMMAGV